MSIGRLAVYCGSATGADPAFADAARLLGDRFVEPLLLGPEVAGCLPHVLSRLGIAGGAVYDALVALAAVDHGAALATRDVRAKATYEMVGARVLVAG